MELDNRFWSKVDASGECWTWTAYKAPNGYGQFGLGGKTQYAHRVSYELVKGPIPDGLQIDHLCRNRLCVNPAHLEAVTCRENLLRGETITARNAHQAHCPKGHPYDEENTHWCRGERICGECKRARDRKYYQREGVSVSGTE